jgi:uncharacterized protein (TIGR02301 family)
MVRRSAAIQALALLIAGTAGAQQPQPEPRTPPDGPVRGEEWYQAQLTELSEVLGGAHYLRILCEGRGDQRWRDYMRQVISREPEHNALLVEGFNRGYRQEEARFSQCDETSRQVEAELRARGLRVAQGLSARHAE